MGINIPGLIGVVVFYALILVVGIWASYRRKKKQPDNIDRGNACNEHDDVILAGRDIGCLVGTFTMTATWVGGGYINGTAQAVYTDGLVSAQAPWGYALSLTIGGMLFAKKMRDAGYVTMLDPLQEKYGKVMGSILFIPALLGELFWSAAILGSLGTTLSVVLQVDIDYAVIGSACVAVAYTSFGGLYAVAFTDVAQLLCIFIGLWLTIPFAMLHDDVAQISTTQRQWLGEFDMEGLGIWMDYAFLLSLGGIPWQAYFQRVLAAKSAKYARLLSLAAAAGCIVMAIPAILIGAIAKSTNWYNVLNNTEAPPYLTTTGDIIDKRLVLPLVLQYLTPGWVTFLGLGAICAAVMSSADSSILSASSLFSYNIYKTTLRKKASPKELLWVIRIAILAMGAAATAIGLNVKSIYNLWVLSSDLVFVVLFPQLLCAVYMRSVNIYGSIPALLIGMVLRIGGGEKIVGLPTFIEYPFYDALLDKQYFPFRMFSMIASMLTLIACSFLGSLCEKKFRDPRTQQEIDILKISYKEPERSTVTSFSKISRWSGSYNSITASALELRSREDRSLLKTMLNRNASSCSQRPIEVYDERQEP